MDKKMTPIKMLCTSIASTNLTSYSLPMKQLQDMFVNDIIGSLVSPLARCNGNGQRGTTVWFNCNQMWREKCSTLGSVASGWLIIMIIWLYCGSNCAKVKRKKLKGAAVFICCCLLYWSVWELPVRGHWSVTVVQMRTFPGTIMASPGYSKGILFTWQTWQRMHKPTKKNNACLVYVFEGAVCTLRYLQYLTLINWLTKCSSNHICFKPNKVHKHSFYI